MLEGEPPDIRFEPLWVAAQVAAWFGDSDEFERWAKDALAAAREAERKDLEANVIHGLVTAYVLRLELAEAAPLVAARARARRRRAAASSAAPRRSACAGGSSS